jgi:hypothetical protein
MVKKKRKKAIKIAKIQKDSKKNRKILIATSTLGKRKLVAFFLDRCMFLSVLFRLAGTNLLLSQEIVLLV